MKPAAIVEIVADRVLVPADRLRSTTQSTLKKLVQAGAISKPRPGTYEA